MCVNCNGYCENACRRKKIDQPVSIRNTQLFIARSINKYDPSQDTNIQSGRETTAQKGMKNINLLRNRFNSRIGKLGDDELKEWLKECIGNGTRIREITDFESAATEAENCMHCDCRASGNCKLREIAEEYSLKDPAGKLINATIEKKINYNTGLIFEYAKCIKCGLCIRVCEDSKDDPALCFIGKGFVARVSEPLTEKFENILKTKADICIEVCPTGALKKFK